MSCRLVSFPFFDTGIGTTSVSILLFLPIFAPRVGIKINAMSKDAVNVAINVIGRNFMNSPTIPGQKIRGMKAASVVPVDAVIGHAILLADLLYASSRDIPAAICRSANSVTTIAPSTNIPTARIRLKSTTILIDSPKEAKTRIPSRKDPGIAIPTSKPERHPSAPMMIIITNKIALITLFCRSSNI